MGKYSKKDIMRIVADEDVEFIRMQFTDIFGQLKNVAITASQLEKALNNQIMIMSIIKVSKKVPLQLQPKPLPPLFAQPSSHPPQPKPN